MKTPFWKENRHPITMLKPPISPEREQQDKENRQKRDDLYRAKKKLKK